MTAEIPPGLLILRGNRLDWLFDAVSGVLARHPLAPLEEEHLLVQSNGAAEWLKMKLAASVGICAASRVELPARFVWRTYRQVLGAHAVPASSPLDRMPLVWRLMRLLPTRMDDPAFAPLAGFLAGDGLERRLQLAERLADLFDQYQVYRADWLESWAQGRDVLRGAAGAERAVPSDQRWQPALWRAMLDELDDDERRATRPRVHRDYLAAMAANATTATLLPRRVVVFGASHMPGQTLEALAALAGRSQVLVAITDPSRYHWSDIIDGRELLPPARRRHAARGGVDLASVPIEAMHAHAHPLLAAWGRQGRDFMCLLDTFDDTERTRVAFGLPRVDLYGDEAGSTLLEQAQAAVRDLLPLGEHPPRVASPADRSIVFHVAHSPQREVEVLHDQLLEMFAATAGSNEPIQPRDVVVMVPDIDVFAAAIRAVFGQHAPSDPRRIPFGIVDIRARGCDPAVAALEWLLRAPTQRFRASEVHDLLEVPAVARRFGIAREDVATLTAWIAGSGVRWGLDASHRGELGLQASGEQNSWSFGLQRMLLGYASGAPFEGIEPYDEVGGLDASLAGALADLVERLRRWAREAGGDATPRQWATRGRALMADLFDAEGTTERLTVASLDAALADWLAACERAGFDEPVPLPVFREAWLAAIDPPGGGRRFLAGGVTFCTLMPLRSVPFPVVCLLGMNDGAYPRPSRRSDFDLVGLPGQHRPGDRSRRDDDRYLMLEALLSARRVLYVSWSGRSPRDNSEQPPSVLVSQLRDYLRAGWPGDVADADPLAVRTTEHPLQPFSARYFQTDGSDGVMTHAREWRSAHVGRASDAAAGVDPAAGGEAAAASALVPFDSRGVSLTIAGLSRFLKNPVRTFFRERLDVSFDAADDECGDDEAFSLRGLQRHALREMLLQRARASTGRGDRVRRALEGVRGAGSLPIGEAGVQVGDALAGEIGPLLAAEERLLSRYPRPLPPRHARIEAAGIVIDDWLDGLHTDGAASIWLDATASVLLEANGQRPQAHKLIDAWVRTLVASACGIARPGFLVAPDATLHLGTLETAPAQAALRDLLMAWRQGMDAPLPLPRKTGLARALGEPAGRVYEGDDREGGFAGEGDETCLARTFASYAALTEDGRFETLSQTVYGPMIGWIADAVRIERHTPAPEQQPVEATDD